MKKIVVLISGSGSNLQAIIDNCKSKYIQAEIVCVISNNPKPMALKEQSLLVLKLLLSIIKNINQEIYLIMIFIKF